MDAAAKLFRAALEDEVDVLLGDEFGDAARPSEVDEPEEEEEEDEENDGVLKWKIRPRRHWKLSILSLCLVMCYAGNCPLTTVKLTTMGETGVMHVALFVFSLGI